MPNQKKNILQRFLIWRYRHISNKNFVFMLSVLVGFLAGLVSVLLKNSTHLIQIFLENGIVSSRNSLYFILPILGLLLVYLLVKFVLKKPVTHAIPSILRALSKRNGILKRYKMYFPLITAPLTVGFGGSVGLLGPAVASGAAISSNVSVLFHINNKTRTLLIGCAAASAIAAVFKSPIAGIVFAVEVFSLDLTLISLLPLLLASVSSIVTSYFFLGSDVLFRFEVKEQLMLSRIPFYVLLGVGTAFASIYFSKMYFAIIKFFERFENPLYRLLIGGLGIGVLLYFIPPLYGEGFSFINKLLHDQHLEAIGTTPFDAYLHNIWVVIALLIGITVFKAVAMTATFAAGGAGGIFIPTMVMGSALGNVVAKVINNLGLGFHVSEANFTLLGMAGLIAGVIHAPLTAIFLIAEITSGYELFVPLMITAAISFLISKNILTHNIYTRELAEKGALLTHDKDESVLTLMNLDKVIETNFISVQPEHSLEYLLHEAVAKSSRNIFPVVNEDEALLGIILLDDIRDIMFDRSQYKKVTVEELMRQAPDVIFYKEDNAKRVMKKFQDTGAWNLPVMKDGRYFGFISKSKLLTAYRRKLISSR